MRTRTRELRMGKTKREEETIRPIVRGATLPEPRRDGVPLLRYSRLSAVSRRRLDHLRLRSTGPFEIRTTTSTSIQIRQRDLPSARRNLLLPLQVLVDSFLPLSNVLRLLLRCFRRLLLLPQSLRILLFASSNNNNGDNLLSTRLRQSVRRTSRNGRTILLCKNPTSWNSTRVISSSSRDRSTRIGGSEESSKGDINRLLEEKGCSRVPTSYLTRRRRRNGGRTKTGMEKKRNEGNGPNSGRLRARTGKRTNTMRALYSRLRLRPVARTRPTMKTMARTIIRGGCKRSRNLLRDNLRLILQLRDLLRHRFLFKGMGRMESGNNLPRHRGGRVVMEPRMARPKRKTKEARSTRAICGIKRIVSVRIRNQYRLFLM